MKEKGVTASEEQDFLVIFQLYEAQIRFQQIHLVYLPKIVRMKKPALQVI